ncbi:YfhO family protein [Candidatus Woesearchaeota archaeon]|nr:YfhO family protein [Candidatus Woesearchaeota archaeon]
MMKKEWIIKLNGMMRNYGYIIALFAITLVFFSQMLSSSKILSNIHYVNDMTFESENMLKHLKERSFPLWTPYFYSGQPLMAIPEYYLFDLNFLYILIFRNIFLAMNLSLVSYFFLAGLGMYLLVHEITKKRNAAFISALIFMFNGFMHNFILRGHLNILESYALIPFVFLFVHKALHAEKWLMNSVIASLFFSMMIYNGGMIFFLYTGLIIAFYIIWSLIGSNVKKRFFRAALVSLSIIILLFGLSALKLLPVLEFTKISSRGLQVNYNEYLGNPISPSNFLTDLIKMSKNSGFSAAIGFTSSFLLLFGLWSFRKKIVLFSILLIVLSILLATGTFAAKFFYQLPGFGQMRHIERSLAIFIFSSSIIAAFGFNNLTALLTALTSKYAKNIKEWIILIIILSFLVAESIVLQQFPESIEIKKPNDIPILNEISKDKSYFRIATYGLSTPIGASGYNYYSQLGMPEIKGGGGIWMNDYVQYLLIAQENPSKMFGMLSGKYIVSDKSINDNGLVLKNNTFEDCKKCLIWEAYGPYLYENKYSIPRAFLVNNSVLAVGNINDKAAVFFDMANSDLNPFSTVLVSGKEHIGDYSDEELLRFNAIMLLRGSVTEEDIPKLQKYANNSGKIIPDILKGEDAVYQYAISNAFKPNPLYKILEMKDISLNEYSVMVNNETGWLVVSERFAHFPGWKAEINGKELQMYKANSVITAVYLNSANGQLKFKYKPDSFKFGSIITIITILILIGYFIYQFLHKGLVRNSVLVRPLPIQKTP